MTRSALQNAASIAALFLTTEAVIADKPEKAAPAMPGGDGGWAAWTSESDAPAALRYPEAAPREGGRLLAAARGCGGQPQPAAPGQQPGQRPVSSPGRQPRSQPPLRTARLGRSASRFLTNLTVS